MANKKIYIYPKLPAVYDLGVIRFGGSGLANCMFVAARAYILHTKTNFDYITPTWGKFSIGPYLRGEKDKRHYFGFFKKLGVSGIMKIAILATKPKINEHQTKEDAQSGIIVVEGLGNYFLDLLDHQEIVSIYFHKIILKKHFSAIESHDFSKVIGVHIRLGDYSSDLRTDLNWYKQIIESLQKGINTAYQFYVFSDGTDEELSSITSLANTKRVFFGSAISDILALSHCQLIIGSDSTFSGWGAFLGQVPVVYPKRHFGRVLVNSKQEFVSNEPEIVVTHLLLNYKNFS